MEAPKRWRGVNSWGELPSRRQGPVSPSCCLSSSAKTRSANATFHDKCKSRVCSWTSSMFKNASFEVYCCVR
eukprot:1144705-Pelagomonas_calceolata.AAC.1